MVGWLGTSPPEACHETRLIAPHLASHQQLTERLTDRHHGLDLF